MDNYLINYDMIKKKWNDSINNLCTALASILHTSESGIQIVFDTVSKQYPLAISNTNLRIIEISIRNTVKHPAQCNLEWYKDPVLVAQVGQCCKQIAEASGFVYLGVDTRIDHDYPLFIVKLGE